MQRAPNEDYQKLFLVRHRSQDNGIDLLNSLLRRLRTSTGTQQCGVFEGCDGRLEDGVVKVTCIPWKISLLTGVLVLFTLLTVISNSTIVAVIIRTKSLRKQSGFFKLSLALSQLIYGATYLPSVIHNINSNIFYDVRDSAQLNLVRESDVRKTLTTNYLRSNITNIPDLTSTNLNETEMKIFAFIGYLTSIVTVLSLFMISVDSFVSVRWPLSYRFGSILSKKNAIRIVVVIWITATVLSLLPVFITSAFQPVLFTPSFMYTFSYKELQSTENQGPILKYLHILMYTIVVWGLPFVATWIVTVLMAVQSYKMFKTFKSTTTTHTAAAAADDRPDMDLIRTFTIILATFTITILPIVIILIVFIFSPPETCASPRSTSALFFAFCFYTVGGFFNVLIYNFCHKEFREATRVFLYDVAQSMASVFPCINAVLPFEKQRRARTSSFISTTISRIRSVRKLRSFKQGKPLSRDPAASFEMTSSSITTDSHNNERTS